MSPFQTKIPGAFPNQEQAAPGFPRGQNAAENEQKRLAYLAHLAAIVESSEDAIISKLLDGTITSWNHGGEKMFGYTAKDVVGKNISLIIPAGYRSDEKEIQERIRKNEFIDHFETVRVKKNGEKIHVSLKVSPLKDATGCIIGISKIIRDITLRKRAEAAALLISRQLRFQNLEREKRAAELIVVNGELAYQNSENEKRTAELIIANKELVFQNEDKEKRAAELTVAIRDLETSEAQVREVNKELESFSYSVSHDLRAPLRAINGYTKMLKAELGTSQNDEATRLMNNIIDNAKKMGLLIDDLLAFSRIGRRELVKINIPMHALVQGICNELKEEAPGRHIEFRINKLLPALADNMAIKQVWLNLVSNAIKYSRLKDNALVEIGSKANGKEVTYFIKDNGAGFDMRYANKLFGVFQRLHSDEEFEGTGVGLALVHRIISKHGGRTWAEGKVNEGATFYFTLYKS